MWSRYEIGNDLMSNSMIVNLNMFGPFMKSMVVNDKDGNLVVTKHEHIHCN